MVMLAKGNRSQQVTDACKKYGGFYLGSIGGPAAILAQNNIKSIECVEYPELGMEAIWKIEVENFPAFILVDDGTMLTRCFVGQSCKLGHNYSASDSLFFSNCQGENGEACAIFAGPDRKSTRLNSSH